MCIRVLLASGLGPALLGAGAAVVTMLGWRWAYAVRWPVWGAAWGGQERPGGALVRLHVGRAACTLVAVGWSLGLLAMGDFEFCQRFEPLNPDLAY